MGAHFSSSDLQLSLTNKQHPHSILTWGIMNAEWIQNVALNQAGWHSLIQWNLFSYIKGRPFLLLPWTEHCLHTFGITTRPFKMTQTGQIAQWSEHGANSDSESQRHWGLCQRWSLVPASEPTCRRQGYRLAALGTRALSLYRCLWIRWGLTHHQLLWETLPSGKLGLLSLGELVLIDFLDLSNSTQMHDFGLFVGYTARRLRGALHFLKLQYTVCLGIFLATWYLPQKAPLKIQLVTVPDGKA